MYTWAHPGNETLIKAQLMNELKCLASVRHESDTNADG